MLAVSLFYLLFLILIILLIFMVLLYTGYHSRTLVPSLLDNFYGFSAENNTDISNTDYVNLYINDGATDYTSVGVSGSIDFGTSGANGSLFSFRPMREDNQRKLRGNITLLISRQNSDINNINFQLLDEGDNKVVADGTDFRINPYTEGLTEVKLYFVSNNLKDNNIHNFILQGKSTSTGVSANQVLLNSAYMYYY